MKKIGISDAKTHFTQLLTEVEESESVIITRRGKAIARITPYRDHPIESTQTVIARMLQRRAKRQPIATAEILAIRDEARGR